MSGSLSVTVDELAAVEAPSVAFRLAPFTAIAATNLKRKKMPVDKTTKKGFNKPSYDVGDVPLCRRRKSNHEFSHGMNLPLDL